MKASSYKKALFMKSLIQQVIVAGCILMVLIITIVLITMQQSESVYLEGAAKSIPLMSDEMMAELGDIYVTMENEFEAEIQRIVLGTANRHDKRDREIHYGVNGRMNDEISDGKNIRPDEDMLKNQDYVNGINLKYIKSDPSKFDGESNFIDIISVISAIYGEDCDRYKDDVKKTFKELFTMSHTYTTDTTELYPCKHGCATVLYYCGDSMVQGEYGGEKVGHFNSDLKYNPFKIAYHNEYRSLQDYYDNLNSGYEIDVGFTVEEYEGICEVHNKGKTEYSGTQTTKDFAGCNELGLECYHGEALTKTVGEGEDKVTYTVCEHCLGSSHEDCDNYEAITECIDEGTDEHNCHAGEVKEDSDGNPIYDEDGNEVIYLGCGGYYECKGHPHWNCHGHVLVCCFGHTTINIDINILYYEALLDEFRKLGE